MNNYESVNTKLNFEPQELEFWELDDFVDVIQCNEVSNLEHDFSSDCSIQSMN